MFPESLHHAEAPAHALLDKLRYFLRGLCHSHGKILILNDITTLDDTHRQVAVLRECIRGETTCFHDSLLAEGTNGSRYHGDGIDVRVSHSVEVLTGRILDSLPVREHVTLVTDLHITCHSTDAMLLVDEEMLHELAHGIRLELCVRIDADNKLRVGM